MSDYAKVLGKKIRDLRKLSGLTQVELAAELGYTSTGTISQIEKGVFAMSVLRRQKAASVLRVSDDYLSSTQYGTKEMSELQQLLYDAYTKGKDTRDFRHVRRLLVKLANK